jgi:hypothetical protein
VALVVLLAIPLAFLLSRVSGDFVRDVIAAPFLYLAWIGRVYVRTVPRTLFWGALLLFGLALALTNALTALGGSGGEGTNYAQDAIFEQSYTGPVRQLRSQIRYASRSTYFRRRLAQRMGRLILKSLDVEEPYGRAKVERGLEALDAPPEIREFLREGGRLISPSQPVGLITWLRRRLHGGEVFEAPSPELERVVRFLEERLEVL